jgi:hypothetical protein
LSDSPTGDIGIVALRPAAGVKPAYPLDVAKKKWSELSAYQRRAIYVAGAVEAVMTGAALLDLARRPAGQIRGPKVAWALASFVQPVGPIAYFAAARR